VIALVVLLGTAVAVLAAVLAWRSRTPRALRRPREGRRLLVPFTGSLDETVLHAAIRIAHAEQSVLVPAYLLVVPLEYAEDSPVKDRVERALPLLEAVERAGLEAGVPVDARIEKGRTPTHALRRLWEVEPFDQILVPASSFTEKELAWVLTHSPTETLVLKPLPLAA
jgi:uncharacterized membrane protein YccC